MRRLLLALLFPLVLAAQQAAFVHAFQHLPSSVPGTSGTQDERHPPGDPYCQKCFVFAQLGATADLPPVPAVLVDGTFDLIGFAAPVASILPVRTPRNRGPPLPL
jgi:hypothetical protein